MQVLKNDAFTIPGVWPLRGLVDRCKKHYYSGDVFSFPPQGLLLEVFFTGGSPNQAHIGTLVRENGDTWFLAWLSRLEEVWDDPEKIGLFKDAASNVAMRINARETDAQKLGKAYQAKENEENAEFLGHGPIMRNTGRPVWTNVAPKH